MSLPILRRRLVPAVALAALLASPGLQAQHEGHDHGPSTPQATSDAPLASLAFQLSADPAEVDFGDAYQGEVLVQEVIFTNTGSEPFPVLRIQTSCGCTVAKLFGPNDTELPTKPRNNQPIVVLAPGEQLKTNVEFKTAGKHGQVEQRMQVHHTDPKVTPASVPVKVRVSKGIEITPAWVNLGNVAKSERREQIVTISSLDLGDWKVTGFESQIEEQPLPEWLSFEVLPVPEPEEGINAAPVLSNERKVKIIVDGELPVGAISPRVRILVDHERIGHVDFTITGIVQSNVTFKAGEGPLAQNINFDKVAPDAKVTRTVVIENLEPEAPYLLESADLLTSKKDFFSTEIRTIEAGVKYEVDITVDGAIGDPFFRGSLVLRADHPDEPSKMLPFHGWVRK